MKQALVFDLGGTFLRSATVDAAGALKSIVRQHIPSTTAGYDAAAVWNAILRAIVEYAAAHCAALSAEDPIVVSFPGPVAARRRILQAPTVAGASEIPDIAGELERATARPTYLINDLSAAAWYFGTQTVANRFQVVTVSSGIGSKVFDRCHPARVLDEPAYGGEIGHLVVDDSPSAPICDCGGKGHLGGIASGRGVERAARIRAGQEPSGFEGSLMATRFCANPANITNEAHVVPAALAGDAFTLRLLRDCTRPLARTLLSTVMAVGLDRIFVIGGFAESLGPLYLQLLRELIRDMSRYEVVFTQLASLVEMGKAGQEVCLQGCAAYLHHGVHFER